MIEWSSSNDRIILLLVLLMREQSLYNPISQSPIYASEQSLQNRQKSTLFKIPYDHEGIQNREIHTWICDPLVRFGPIISQWWKLLLTALVLYWNQFDLPWPLSFKLGKNCCYSKTVLLPVTWSCVVLHSMLCLYVHPQALLPEHAWYLEFWVWGILSFGSCLLVCKQCP